MRILNVMRLICIAVLLFRMASSQLTSRPSCIARSLGVVGADGLYSATRGSMEKSHSRALDLYAYIWMEILTFMSLIGHTFHLALCTPFVT